MTDFKNQTHIKMTWEVFQKLMDGLQAGLSDHFYWLDTWELAYRESVPVDEEEGEEE